MRRAAAGSGAIGATEPLPAAGTEAPRGVTHGSGGGPSHGASTRASTPMTRSARAMPSTWPCTPPGMLRLYGQTRPTRTRRPPASTRAHSATRGTQPAATGPPRRPAEGLCSWGRPGQLGCTRCHWVGAWPDQVLQLDWPGLGTAPGPFAGNGPPGGNSIGGRKTSVWAWPALPK